MFNVLQKIGLGMSFKLSPKDTVCRDSFSVIYKIISLLSAHFAKRRVGVATEVVSVADFISREPGFKCHWSRIQLITVWHFTVLHYHPSFISI